MTFCARYDEDELTHVYSVAGRVHRLTLLEPRGKAVSVGEQLKLGEPSHPEDSTHTQAMRN